jgi:hypothetical protein
MMTWSQDHQEIEQSMEEEDKKGHLVDAKKV